MRSVLREKTCLSTLAVLAFGINTSFRQEFSHAKIFIATQGSSDSHHYKRTVSFFFKNKRQRLPQFVRRLQLALTMTSIGNSTEYDFEENIRFPMYLRLTATTICIILLTIGCPGNLLVPYVVFKTKELRNSTNIFLINLSVSDLLILLITSPTVLIELHSQPEVWFLGLFMCEYFKTISLIKDTSLSVFGSFARKSRKDIRQIIFVPQTCFQ